MAKSIISSVKSEMTDFEKQDLFKDISAPFDSGSPSDFLSVFKVLFLNEVNKTNTSDDFKARYKGIVNAWTMDNIQKGIREGWLKEDY
jgi:hypothetical protein